MTEFQLIVLQQLIHPTADFLWNAEADTAVEDLIALGLAIYGHGHGNRPIATEAGRNASRVIEVATHAYHGDQAAISRFMSKPHSLLDGRTPLEMIEDGPSGAEAVTNLLKRANSGFPV